MDNTPIDKHIYRLIADSMISVSEKTQFGSAVSLSEYIHGEIRAKRIENISAYVYPTIELIKEVYGLNMKEATLYISKYFRDSKWLTYHKPTFQYRGVFGKFLSD